jgi:hypothetical protein
MHSTTIRRPLVRLTSISKPDLLLTGSETSLEELQLGIGVEDADVADLKVSYEAESNDDLTVTVRVESIPLHEKHDLFSDENTKTLLVVKGKGLAIIKIKAHYRDYANNEYEDVIGQITIQVSNKIQQSIPVYYPTPQEEMPLLVTAH